MRDWEANLIDWMADKNIRIASIRWIAHCRFADLERGSRLEPTTMGDAYLQQAMEVLLG
ncbi:hypothetical protein [Ferrimicrobium acidiphilum]|uniref:hypothetical protein n=1 Tax=Ferrimicrobium acidiphilum TaxID=121039 RepID=UPI0023EF8F9B|nr:hypothetical protein [Ferrimicrobium acidiphilum]